MKPPRATGAQIDEGSVRLVIRVSPERKPESDAAPSDSKNAIPKRKRVRTLADAFELAHNALVEGIPTKIEIEQGRYREAVLGLDWTQGNAAETPLIVEGVGEVIWSGADVFPLHDWKPVDGIWVHPWPYRWGNFGYSWSVKGLVGHRSEMAFINGRPLMPRILERFDVNGIDQDPAKPGSISYTYVDTRDPAATLLPGQFGVIEGVNGKASGIYVRPSVGEKLGPQSIEVSVRRNLLDLRGKSRVVLRNISFTQVANSDEDVGASNAIRFSIDPTQLSHDVLIDRCKVTWSAFAGLHIDGEHWTVRDSEFNFNGGSGMSSGKSFDVLWERNVTNFNVWRLWRAGELGYYTGGFKMHETTRHTILGHGAVGNCTMGAWWDVHCRDVQVSDLIAVGNAANLQFELGEGPFFAERILLAGGRAGDAQIRMWEHGPTTLRDSILYSNYVGSGSTGLYNLRWFGRKDVHARMSKIVAGDNKTQDNIFVAGPNVPNFGMFDDIRGHEWSLREPMSYHGTGNIFYSPTVPNLQDKWIIDEGRTGELAARAFPLKNWLRAPTYSEVDAKNLDPQFRDPETYDFRFAPTSPLYSMRSRYPQYAMSDATHAQWKWFVGWSGYHPEAWNVPPPE